jgi:hypothetical protein
MTPSTFWLDPLHCMLRDMLLAQAATEAALPAAAAPRAWHRVVYINVSDLARANGALASFGEPAPAQAWPSTLLTVWGAGLSWAISRFGLPVDSEHLVQAIAGRMRTGQALYGQGPVSSARVAEIADEMVERAGRGLFSFEYFMALAYALGIDDIGELHDAFLANSAPQ